MTPRRPAWLDALIREADARTEDDRRERSSELEVDDYATPPQILIRGCDSEGFLYQRTLDDGRLIAVEPQTFGCARIGIGPADSQCFDDVWDFSSQARAIAEATSWNPAADPEPEGWHRHEGTGRYRPNGDPAQEYTKKR